jgi:hypothetical protein
MKTGPSRSASASAVAPGSVDDRGEPLGSPVEDARLVRHAGQHQAGTGAAAIASQVRSWRHRQPGRIRCCGRRPSARAAWAAPARALPLLLRHGWIGRPSPPRRRCGLRPQPSSCPPSGASRTHLDYPSISHSTDKFGDSCSGVIAEHWRRRVWRNRTACLDCLGACVGPVGWVAGKAGKSGFFGLTRLRDRSQVSDSRKVRKEWLLPFAGCAGRWHCGPVPVPTTPTGGLLIWQERCSMALWSSSSLR